MESLDITCPLSGDASNVMRKFRRSQESGGHAAIVNDAAHFCSERLVPSAHRCAYGEQIRVQHV